MIRTPNGYRTCMKCSRTKILLAYRRNQIGKRHRYCAECQDASSRRQLIAGASRTVEYRQDERQRAAAKESKSYRTQQEVRLTSAYWRVQRETARDCAIAYRAWLKVVDPPLTTKERYWSDPEYRKHKIEESRRIRQANPEKERTRVKAYKAANPHKAKHWNNKRQSRVSRRADGTVTREATISLLDASTECFWCGEPMDKKTLDHVIPIDLGGMHTLSNLVVSCLPCNASKHARHPDEWVRSLPRSRRVVVEKALGVLRSQ